ncbi:MAG: four helix bundle protein [Bacteroidota bacterium]
MVNKIETFEDLDIWKKSVELYVEIFQVCEEGNLAKDFTSRDQIKRAALSISNNIAEGFEYENNLQFMRYLRYSKGSAGEVRSMLYVLNKTGQIDKKTYQKLNDSILIISKSIKNFLKYLDEHKRKSTL